MKFLVLFSIIVGVIAEPPRFRPARFRYQRLELAPTTTDMPSESTTEASGPYAPSGWKPSGAQFTLPIDTTPTPMDTYGPPIESDATGGPYPPSGWKPQGQAFNLPQESQNTVPDNKYGVPDNTYGTPSTEATTTANPQAEVLVQPIEVQKSVGMYYVLLPNGQLQRIEFVTENDIQNMNYTARLQLSDRAPLYVFGP